MTVRLRHLAEINPSVPGWDQIPDDRLLTFVPLEAVWPRQIDFTRERSKSETSTGYTRFMDGDVIVPKITPTFEADRSTWVNGSPTHVLTGTTELHVVRAGPRLEPRYLDYVFSSHPFLQEGASQMVGVAGQKRISDEWLRNYRIPMVALKTQRKIADYLDTETARIDALISKKRRLIELLEEHWRELRRANILRGLDPVHGGGLNEQWYEMNLGVLLELQRGHDLPSDNREDGTIPVVSSGGVSGFHNIAIADGPGVITGRYGTVGEVFFVDTPYWPLNTTLYVKDFRGNDPKWIYHLLASVPLDIDSQKSAVGGINRNIVGSLRVPKPPVPEQRAIARDLDEAEDLSMETRTRLEIQIRLLHKRRQALILALVTGTMTPGMAA